MAIADRYSQAEVAIDTNANTSAVRRHIAKTHVVVSNIHDSIVSTQTVVSGIEHNVVDTHTLVSDIHRNMQQNQGGADQHNLVSVAIYLPRTECLSFPRL